MRGNPDFLQPYSLLFPRAAGKGWFTGVGWMDHLVPSSYLQPGGGLWAFQWGYLVFYQLIRYEFFFFWVYGTNILSMCLCVCLCVCLFQRQYSEAHSAKGNVHLYPWDCSGAGGAWGSFTCRRSHQFFSSMPCTQRDKILTMDFQIQSYSALSSAPFWKAATWNNPEIANLPANPSTVLSPIPRLQMNSLSYLGFGEKFHSVHVTHSSSCWDNGKDKPTLGCQETTITKHTKNRNY